MMPLQASHRAHISCIRSLGKDFGSVPGKEWMTRLDREHCEFSDALYVSQGLETV